MAFEHVAWNRALGFIHFYLVLHRVMSSWKCTMCHHIAVIHVVSQQLSWYWLARGYYIAVLLKNNALHKLTQYTIKPDYVSLFTLPAPRVKPKPVRLAVASANVNPVLCRRIASTGHNELKWYALNCNKAKHRKACSWLSWRAESARAIFAHGLIN